MHLKFTFCFFFFFTVQKAEIGKTVNEMVRDHSTSNVKIIKYLIIFFFNAYHPLLSMKVELGRGGKSIFIDLMNYLKKVKFHSHVKNFAVN